jgi:hypothetical protein
MTLDVTATVNQTLVDQVAALVEELSINRDHYNDLYKAVENWHNDPDSTGNENKLYAVFEAARERRLKNRK